jgi:hypothetical protein
MYRITYVLGGEQAYRDKAMRIILAALTMVNREYFLTMLPHAPNIFRFKFQEEPPGVDDWQDASASVALGSMDCEDAACYVAAWIQAKHGILAWPQIVRNEAGKMHIVVELPDGRKFDPTLVMKVPRKPAHDHECTNHGAGTPEQRITIVTDLFRSRTRFGFNGSPTDIPQDLAHKSLSYYLHALYLIDCLYLQLHPEAPKIYEAGVHYEEEPPGREDWQDIPTSVRRKNGDCEDLASWRAAELCVRQGIRAYPTFIWKVRPSGAYLYHIQTTYPDGSVEDPSRRLGMGQNREG